jgi:zinc protease
LLELYKLDRSYVEGYAGALTAVTLDRAKQTIDQVYPTSDNVTLVVIGKAAALREGLRKYGPLTEMKVSDPAFAPSR